MKLCIFDTETTGLPLNYKQMAYQGPDNWPHIVSIAWVILDGDTNQILKKKYHIINPTDWVIPDESIAIHKITNEFAKKMGISIQSAIIDFLNEEFDLLVAHNLEFDYNVLVNAMKWDCHMNIDFFPRTKCTMKIGKDLCKIPFKNAGYKYPKLKELYQYAFKRTPIETSLHSSIYDVAILTEIIQHCDPVRNGLRLPTKEFFQRNGNREEETLFIKLTD
jgi:DNA polymerase III epsilon subunit-like protein